MSSVVRPLLGAALLMTGASAVMAQSANPPVAYQAVQTSAPATPGSTPVAYQSPGAGASTPIAAANSTPISEAPKKHSSICDNTDRYGGHEPSSHWGTRAFWDGQGNGN
jgi:hypothetical protein